jgi:hypothetical protein
VSTVCEIGSAFNRGFNGKLEYLVNHIRENTAIVVYMVCRFSRNVQQFDEFIEILNKKKCFVIDASRGITSRENAFRELVEIAEADSKYKSDIMKLRHKTKLLIKKSFNSRVPYGYQVICEGKFNKLLPIKEEQDIVSFVVKNICKKRYNAEYVLYELCEKFDVNFNKAFLKSVMRFEKIKKNYFIIGEDDFVNNFADHFAI